MDKFLTEFLAKHRLPEAFRSTATEFYIPLAERVVQRLGDTTFVLGINGTQGSGKSTLADFIRGYLEHQHGTRVANVSIDDIYLTRAEREFLSETVHPLLKTRGVPGTHDVDLGLELIQALKSLSEGEELTIPRFDKAKDDRFDRAHWDQAIGPVDLIIFEGWCVGSLPAEEESLEQPVNKLEADEDTDSRWRYYVNLQLAQKYPLLFAELDALVLLKAPSFECVHAWRLEQERKLELSLAAVTGNDMSGIMSEEQIARFIQHYERITRANLNVLPECADAVLELGEDHQVQSVSYRTI